MSPVDSEQGGEEFRSGPPIQCDDCASAMDSGGDGVSFLLLDNLTVPLIGCAEHVEQFRSVCGYTSGDAAQVLDHRPAGGVPCPSCHLAPHSGGHPVVPVQRGAVALLACARHQSAILERYDAGLETQQQLTTGLDG